MKRSNSKQKAQSAFKKLEAVALITATIFFVACNQAGGGGNTGGGGGKPKPTPKPKHAINFSVDSTTPNGTLKAKTDGVAETETSPINIEEGKEITFTATANSGYRVKGWTLDGNAITEAGTKAEYSHTVTTTATVKVSFESKGTTPNVPSVEGGAVLTLSPDHLTIKVKAVTADKSAVTVEGCNVNELASDVETTLTATGTTVILKGKITELKCPDNQLTALNIQGLTSLQELWCGRNQIPELNVQGLTALQKLDCNDNKLPELNVQGLTALKELDCSRNQLTELNVQGLTSLQELNCYYNQLTALNVQGLTALKELDCVGNKLTALDVQGLTALQMLNCYTNKLNAQAMTELLKGLPAREAGNEGVAFLYIEITSENEGNCKDYNTPEDLKKAFDGAKSRNWKLQKVNAGLNAEDI